MCRIEHGPLMLLYRFPIQLQFAMKCYSLCLEVGVGLHVLPKLRHCAEIFDEAQRGIRRERGLLRRYAFDAGARNSATSRSPGERKSSDRQRCSGSLEVLHRRTFGKLTGQIEKRSHSSR